jgi:hypothetical protein
MKWLVWWSGLDVTGGVQASLPRRGDKGRNDRIFLKALHHFTNHTITWRALPERFGKRNSVWNHVALRCEKTKRTSHPSWPLRPDPSWFKSVHTA